MHLAVLFAAEHAEDVEASNPILPHWDEVFWGSVCFAIVFALLAWKAWPAIKKAIADREAHIRADLERAESAKSEAEGSLQEYQQQLAEVNAAREQVWVANAPLRAEYENIGATRSQGGGFGRFFSK